MEIGKKPKICILTCLVLCLMLQVFCPIKVRAATTVETDRECSLTIRFVHKGEPITQAGFSLYRVADVSEYGEYQATGSFAKYPVDLSVTDNDKWKEAAETLAAYAVRDGVSPVLSSETDEKGILSWDGLQVGLYLLVGQNRVDGGKRYAPQPVFVRLPEKDAKTDDWIYDVSLNAKAEITPEESSMISLKVVKVWNDSQDAEKKRPESVTVQLLKDGQVNDTQALNAENGWKYTWNDLDGEYEWKVVEKDVPTGYTVSIGQNEGVFVITNTLNVTPPPKEDSPSPKIPPKQDTPSTTVSRSVPNLPQTGMLWWPIPILTICGILLFVTGWVRYHIDE